MNLSLPDSCLHAGYTPDEQQLREHTEHPQSFAGTCVLWSAESDRGAGMSS